MINELNAKIEQINSNIEVLPTNNRKNKEKYIEYLDECLNQYRPMLEQCETEIKNRYNEVLAKYKDLTYSLIDTSIDYNSLKLSDVRAFSSEKMNLDSLLYRLNNSPRETNLDEVNKILLQLISNFKIAGIDLKESDFTHSEAVNLYIKTLLSGGANIQDVFNDIYWKNPDIIKQIELNIKYLYYKNEAKLNEFFKTRYASFDFHNFILNHRNLVAGNETIKHQSVKYIYDLFMNKELEVDDFLIESRVQELINNILIDPTSNRNYENLLKCKRTLTEYKNYMKFEYIIKDFKELYSHKAEYKDLFSNKLKEIAKKEKNLFALNKKINNTGFFKLNSVKLADAKLERNKLFDELVKDYEELDGLKIKETINLYVTSESNCYDVLKLVTYNFCYLVKLLEKENEELTIENIEFNLLNLQKFIYDNTIDVINNISLSEDKNIAGIISEMYKLNSITIVEDKLGLDQIDKVIESVDKLLIYYDIYGLMINLKDFRYLIDAPEALRK